jgi:hypothetical protein
MDNPNGKALSAVRIQVANSIFGEDFTAKGELDFNAAKIGGSLIASGAHIANGNSSSLDAKGASVGEDVRLDNGFESRGIINLDQIVIGRDLILSGNTVENPAGIALTASYATIRGSVMLDHGFSSVGMVELVESEIGGDLNCQQGRFRPNSIEIMPALALLGTRVNGTLVLSDIVLYGNINLSYARVRMLSDDRESWPTPGSLILTGFIYDTIDPRSPIDARSRLEWLALQDRSILSIQPYEQLAKVLREMGRSPEADEVLFAEHKMFDSGRDAGLTGRLWSGFLRISIGYGYRVWYCALWAIGIVGFGAILFFKALRTGVLVTAARSNAEATHLIDDLMHSCFYSLELFLPFIRLPEKHVGDLNKRWPGDFVFYGFRAWYLFEQSAGWIIMGLAIAAITGLVK